MEGRAKLGVVGHSWQWFRAAPLLALGHACLIAVAACALPFGLGVLLLPRALGALTAHQLGLDGARQPTPPTWRVGVLLFAPAVTLFVMLCVLTQVSVLADPGWLGLAPLESSWGRLLWRVPLVCLAAVLSSALTAPFAFASCWHVENGGRTRQALLASLAVCHARGGLRVWAWTSLAAALPTGGACALLALSSWLGSGGDQVLLVAAALLWLVTIPVARGLLTACYAAQRPEIPRPEDEPFPPALSLTLGGVSVLFVALLLTCLSLARPSPLGSGGLPDDAPLALHVRAGENTQVGTLTDAGLVLEVSRGAVAILARDGGGVGRLPLPYGARVGSARVTRTGPRTFRADIRTDLGLYGVEFDVEGVRTDDTLRDRFEASLAPVWQLLLALCVCGVGWAVSRTAGRPFDRRRAVRRSGWVYVPALVGMLLGCAALLHWQAFL